VGDFRAEALDAVILEVGLGGRLDAVNAFETDCALLISVDLDHTDYLGDTRERIGSEKAGIFRGINPPSSRIRIRPAAFSTTRGRWVRPLVDRPGFWLLEGGPAMDVLGTGGAPGGLALPALRGDRQLANASAALAALDALRARFPVGMQDIRNGLAHVDLPARFQVLPGRPTVVLDVAHNPQAAGVLAENLAGMAFIRRPTPFSACCGDKESTGSAER